MAVVITQTANPAGVSASSNVATYSAASIGTATASRIVVVAVGSELASTPIASCTIDGNAMSAGTTGNLGAVYSHLFYLAYPTGTTANIAVTFTTNSPSSTQNHIAVYSVTGAVYSSSGSDTSTDMDATDPLTTGSTTIATGGGMLAIAARAGGTGGEDTWANLGEDLDVDGGAFGFTTAYSTTPGTATRTCTAITTGEDGALSWIIFTANQSPTVALNSPADASSDSDTTPTLDFTGTDAESNDVRYNVQIDTANTFDGVPIVADTYNESNADSDQSINNVTFGKSQSFTGISGILKSAKWYIRKSGSPTGNATAKVYAHSGTFGTSSIPTGSALATSDTFDVSTLTTSNQLITFTFSGANQITLTGGTKYVVTIEYGSGTAGDVVITRRDASSASHAGNLSTFNGTDWIVSATTDMIFYVYVGTPLLDKVSGAPSSPETFNATSSWTAPVGVTSITVEAWGGGGGGAGEDGTQGGGGGGGGAYSKKALTVVPGATYTVTVGAGGAGGAVDGAGVTGGDSWFNSVGEILAKGGEGGHINNETAAGGAAGSGVGDTTTSGGTGGAGGGANGGGGGGSGGTGGNGGNGGTGNGGSAAGGAAGSGTGGTAGAAGGAGSASTTVGGSPGTAPGGGGGGAGNTDGATNTTGAGGAGRVVITYSFTGDTGFDDPDSADTDPFTSGVNIQYTVQGGDALAANTYYWRVAGIDPSGSNIYGAWSSTRSFTISSGGGGTPTDKFFSFFPLLGG